jgi:hypothetical protein
MDSKHQCFWNAIRNKVFNQIKKNRYSQFIYGLVLSNSQLNRKMLAELAKTEPLTMRAILCLSTEARKVLAEKIRSNKKGKEYDFEYIPFPIEKSRQKEEEYLKSYEKFKEDTKNKSMKEILLQEKEQDKKQQKFVEEELKKMKKKPGNIKFLILRFNSLVIKLSFFSVSFLV